MIKSNSELSNKRIADSRTCIAKCINLLERVKDELHWACEAEGWNEDVAFQVEEAASKLGFALATLVRWDDPEETSEDE